MVKVLISDKMSPLATEVFENRGIEVDVKTGLDKDELASIIGDYDGIAIRSASKLTEKVLRDVGNLKVIGRAGIGVDNVDLTAATQAGVVVMNTPFGNAITTAEHAITLMLSLAREIPAANASTQAGKWEKSRFMGVEIMGKTLGVIGAGNIGAIVCDRAHGLKMKVIAYDPFLTEERAEKMCVEKVDLDTLLTRADFISLHTPLTDQTHNIIDAAAIAKTKPGVRIVNCARGGLVDELALKAAIESGHVAGAALDVYIDEPAKENPLFGMEQVICTPHLGASTVEAQEKVAVQVAEQMADYLLTGAVTNALNMASVTAEEAPVLRPYMALAEQLGAFAGQATQHAIKEIEITFEGDVAGLNTKPLTSIVLKGLLGPLFQGVNMVNAPVIAEERNIKILETRSETAGDYHALITVTVTTEKQRRAVVGTLFNNEPRLVAIKGIRIDAKLGANMLYVANNDKPGLIGKMGTLLGDAGVNIATFNLGRADQGGEAIALIEIDGQPPAEVLSSLQALENVVHAIPMRF